MHHISHVYLFLNLTPQFYPLIAELTLHHYKNYSSDTIRFAPRLNFVIGQNGIGKTNLLDAIYYLCMAKSHATPVDRDTIQFDRTFFRLEALVHLHGADHSVMIKVKPGEVKEISVDGKIISRLSDYIGFLPVIMLAPEDVVLVQGGSAARRKFMDVVLCQADKQYLENLQHYNKVLAQRNALLRMEGHRADRTLLMTYSASMAENASFICRARDALVNTLVPEIITFYAQFCDSREVPALQYLSHLNEQQSLQELASASLETDVQNSRTTKGIHRDDLTILLDNYPVRRFGSQGQIKSLLIAMHLAQMEYLRHATCTTPMLLLDDIFDRLDEQRARHLIRLIASVHGGQVFISDASPARVERLLLHSDIPAQILEIQRGPVVLSYLRKDENENL